MTPAIKFNGVQADFKGNPQIISTSGDDIENFKECGAASDSRRRVYLHIFSGGEVVTAKTLVPGNETIAQELVGFRRCL